MVPLELKNLNNVEMFKSKIRKWKPTQCKYILYLPYVHSTGYLNISNSKIYHYWCQFLIYLFIEMRSRCKWSIIYIYDFVKPGS